MDNLTGNLGIPRIYMPQFNVSVMNEFINHIGIQGLCEIVHPDSLIPTQNEINIGTVASLITVTQVGIFNACLAIIIVAYNFIVDGHHRWAACRFLGIPMRILRILAPVADVLKMSRKFPGVRYQGIDDFSRSHSQ